MAELAAHSLHDLKVVGSNPAGSKKSNLTQAICCIKSIRKNGHTTELHNNLDHHHPEDKQRRSQTKEEALPKAS